MVRPAPRRARARRGPLSRGVGVLALTIVGATSCSPGAARPTPTVTQPSPDRGTAPSGSSPLPGSTALPGTTPLPGTTAPPPPTSLLAPAGAAAALRGPTCAPDATGTWSLRGVLTNTAPSTAVYTVTVSLTRRSGATVVASQVQRFEVAPGGTESIAIGDLRADGPTSELACVFRVVARQVG